MNNKINAFSLCVLACLGLTAANTNAATCSYSVDKEWSSGYNATVTIANNGSTAINGWSLSIKYATNSIASFHSSTITGSNPYTAANVSYNSSIPAGSSVTFGYKGTKNGGAAETPVLSGGVCGTSQTSSSVKSSAAPSSSAPSSAAPLGYTGRFDLPGRIEAEKYNNAYDLTAGNSNTSPFSCTYYGLNVDVAANAQGCLVGWTSAGETLDYAIGNASGNYDLTLRVASQDAGKRIKVLADGATLGTVTTTGGGWSNWEELKITNVNIPGNTRLTVEFVDGAANLDYLNATASSSVDTGKVLWFGDVNKPLKDSFNQLNREPGETGTAVVVDDPTHGKVWKVNKPAGDKRAEFARTNGYIPKEGDKVYVGWRVKVDIAGSKDPSGGFAIFQLKTEGNGEQNHPVDGGFTGKAFGVQAINPGTGCVSCRTRNLVSKPMSENTWTNIVLGFYFSSDASKGHVEVWINGVKQDLLNDNAMQQAAHRTLDTGEMYFKWGAYNETARPFDISVYMDEMRVATSYARAEPNNYTKDGVYKTQ